MNGVGGDGVAEVDAAAPPVEDGASAGDRAVRRVDVDPVLGWRDAGVDRDDAPGGAVAHPGVGVAGWVDGSVAVAGDHLVADGEVSAVGERHGAGEVDVAVGGEELLGELVEEAALPVAAVDHGV